MKWKMITVNIFLVKVPYRIRKEQGRIPFVTLVHVCDIKEDVYVCMQSAVLWLREEGGLICGCSKLLLHPMYFTLCYNPCRGRERIYIILQIPA